MTCLTKFQIIFAHFFNFSVRENYLELLQTSHKRLIVIVKLRYSSLTDINQLFLLEFRTLASKICSLRKLDLRFLLDSDLESDQKSFLLLSTFLYKIGPSPTALKPRFSNNYSFYGGFGPFWEDLYLKSLTFFSSLEQKNWGETKSRTNSLTVMCSRTKNNAFTFGYENKRKNVTHIALFTWRHTDILQVINMRNSIFFSS